MSYILEALERSDRERRAKEREAVPGDPDDGRGASPDPARSGRRIGLAATLALGLLAGSGAWWVLDRGISGVGAAPVAGTAGDAGAGAGTASGSSPSVISTTRSKSGTACAGLSSRPR